ncbi:hypothetical protein TWF696_000788 [Orbilia brochopaga]|uniref:Uncharacterized protein n=1 Tax=Orbilia brochopaga TaxID=3140254 RepID=A0AAV9VEP2_9PEZI
MDTERPYDEGFYTSAERRRNQRIPCAFIVWCLFAVFSAFMFMLTVLFAWHLSVFALPWILFSLPWFLREPRQYRTEPFIPAPQDYVAVENTLPFGYNNYRNGYRYDEVVDVGDDAGKVDHVREEPRREESPLPNFGGFKKRVPVSFMKDALAARDRKLWESDRVGEVDKR